MSTSARQDDATAATARVLAHHLAAFADGVPAILSDYAEHAVVITPDGVHHGPVQISGFFDAFLRGVSPAFWEAFRIDRQIVEGEVAYLVWSAPPFMAMATDTLVVRDGRIVIQSFTSLSA